MNLKMWYISNCTCILHDSIISLLLIVEQDSAGRSQPREKSMWDSSGGDV